MNAMSKEQKQAYAEQVAQRFLSGEFVRHKEEYGVALLEMDEISSDHCCEIMERSGYDPYWLAFYMRDFVLERFAKQIASGDMQVAVLIRAPWVDEENKALSVADYSFFRAFARRTFLGYRNIDGDMKDIIPDWQGYSSIYNVAKELAGIIIIDEGRQDGKCCIHCFENPDKFYEDEDYCDCYNYDPYGVFVWLVEQGDVKGEFEDFWNDNY